jgi:hypothetical protein
MAGSIKNGFPVDFRPKKVIKVKVWSPAGKNYY